MNAPLTKEMLDRATVIPVAHLMEPARTGRVFDLHPALHVGMFACFFAYLGIMWSAFATAELAIPFAIFAIFLAAAFIVPAWWARVAPNEGPKDSFSEFLRNGFQCETGHISAGSAMVQVLIMPVMLVCWGMVIAVIAASV